MSVIAPVRVVYHLIVFGDRGSILLDQWGKVSRISYLNDWEKALIAEWFPYIKMAVEDVSRRSGRNRHGVERGTDRHNFLCAVLMVAEAMKNGSDPEGLNLEYLRQYKAKRTDAGGSVKLTEQKRHEYRLRSLAAVARAKTVLRPGDVIQRMLCGGGKGKFVFVDWEGPWVCGKTLSNCHPMSIYKVNGIAVNFDTGPDIAQELIDAEIAAMGKPLVEPAPPEVEIACDPSDHDDEMPF